MLFIQSFFADLLNGFALSDLPLFLFQLFTSGLIGLVLGRLRKDESKEVNPVLIAVLFALLAAIVKFSLPLSVLVLTLAVLVSGRFAQRLREDASLITFLLSAGAGISCGSGFVIMTLLAFILVLFPAMWFYHRK